MILANRSIISLYVRMSGPPMSRTCPMVAGCSRQPVRYARTLRIAIGWVRLATHRGQTGNQRTEHFERRAARADDHGCAEFRGGHRSASEHIADFVATGQVLREWLRAPAQAAEVDDSFQAGLRGGRSEVPRGTEVTLAERTLAAGHRVDQVVCDAAARQSRAERVAVEHVARDDLDPSHPVPTAEPVRVAGQAADSMALGQQQGYQPAADVASGAGDEDRLGGHCFGSAQPSRDSWASWEGSGARDRRARTARTERTLSSSGSRPSQVATQPDRVSSASRATCRRATQICSSRPARTNSSRTRCSQARRRTRGSVRRRTSAARRFDSSIATTSPRNSTWSRLSSSPRIVRWPRTSSPAAMHQLPIASRVRILMTPLIRHLAWVASGEALLGTSSSKSSNAYVISAPRPVRRS